MSAKRHFAVLVKLVICAALIGTLAATPASAAKVTKCKGDLTGGLYDSVVVPDNKTCNLGSATLTGNLTVGFSATLNGGNVTIGGSVIAQGATNVRLTGFNVAGDVKITGGGGDLTIFSSNVGGTVEVSGVNGAIAIHSNRDPGLRVVRINNNAVRPADPTSTVGLDIGHNSVQTLVQVSGNTGTWIKQVHDNAIGGTLRCIGNELPFESSHNVAFVFEGQCTPPATN